MNLMLPFDAGSLKPPITHRDKIMLMGSCFTEHIGNSLREMKFNILQNPNGILFDTVSVCNALQSYISGQQYTEQDIFLYNGLYQSWAHHSKYSEPKATDALEKINTHLAAAKAYLRNADWLIITFGTSYTYLLNDTAPAYLKNTRNAIKSSSLEYAVANCHKLPGTYFEKKLVAIEDQLSILENTLHGLLHFNPELKIILTVSPVRHLRDGVVNNNRSKARLIEVVHAMVSQFQGVFYFPSYELMIDVLRDHRFYDSDLVHPNYAGTGIVLEEFARFAFEKQTQLVAEEMRQLVLARNHKPLHPDSEPHRAFLSKMHEKTKMLAIQYPYLDFKEELDYFEAAMAAFN